MADSGASNLLEITNAASRGDMFALFDQTRAALSTDPDNPQLRYLQTLALARLGEPHAAFALYLRNRVSEIGTEDALALKGRILKDMAVLARGEEKSSLFRQSSQAYQAANALGDGYFSAINAATTTYLAGDRIEAKKQAAIVAARPEIAQPANYFTAVTAGEALLLCGHVEEAIAQFASACHFEDAALGVRASTVRQLSLVIGDMALKEIDNERLLQAVRPPPVLHFCGHMFCAGWAGEVGLVKQIETMLNETGAVVAFGALACGADILIAEAMLERGGEVHVVLPYVEEDFLATSVTPGGADWVARYERVRNHATSFTLATQMRFIGDDQQIGYGSRLAMGMAWLRAQAMHTEALQLALWDGNPSQGHAGTAFDIAAWAERGGKGRIIPVDADRPRLQRLAAVDAYDGPARHLRAVLFADFSGFSRLSEATLPPFLRKVLGRAGAVLDAHRDAVLCRNSWGDAIYAVIDTPESAAAIALEIQRDLGADFLISIGLPEEGGMRISLHYGPLYEDYDPVRLERTFYGTEVTLAARIEPKVPVGGIYVTQPFAAIIDPRTAEQFRLEYVGAIDLAKNFGSRLIYRLGYRESSEDHRIHDDPNREPLRLN